MADQKLGYNNITWRQPVKEGGSPISGYEIFRNGIPIGTTTASQKWFNDRSGSSFMNETYFVVALNIVGRGIPSFNVTATFMVPLPPPTGIDLEFYNGYVTLTWKRPDIPDYIEITGYKILRASSWSIDDLPLEKWQYLPIGDSTTGQYIDEDPVTGYLSAYRIIAYNELGMGERSDPSIIEIPTNPIPSIPLDLQYSIIKGGIYLRWGISDYTGPSDFQFSIYRSVEDGEMELLNTTDLSDYLDKSVDEGRNYTYWVSCSNEWGESTFAGPVSLFYIANDDDGSEKGGRSWLVYLLIVAILLAILGMAITFVMVNLRRVKADENALFVDEEGEDPGVDSGS